MVGARPTSGLSRSRTVRPSGWLSRPTNRTGSDVALTSRPRVPSRTGSTSSTTDGRSTGRPAQSKPVRRRLAGRPTEFGANAKVRRLAGKLFRWFDPSGQRGWSRALQASATPAGAEAEPRGPDHSTSGRTSGGTPWADRPVGRLLLGERRLRVDRPVEPSEPPHDSSDPLQTPDATRPTRPHGLPTASSLTRRLLPWAVLLLTAAVTLFFRLGSAHTLGSHEVFVAVPAREMLETGDWVLPTYGHLPRLEKPPLAYWVAATVGWLSGGVTEWSVRLPSVLATLGLAALLGFWAARWYGAGRPLDGEASTADGPDGLSTATERTGPSRLQPRLPVLGRAAFGAALIQLTSVWVLTYGRRAEVDMLLTLLTTAATFLLAEELTGPDGQPVSQRRWRLAWTLLALAWLAKFHYGPALVLAPAFLFVLLTRRWAALRGLFDPVGLAVFAAAVLAWPLAVLARCPQAWDVWWQQTVGRALGSMGRDPVWFYGPSLLGQALPWTPLALAAAVPSWRRAWFGHDARERFLWVWLLTQLAVLTASSDKHANYLLATLPVVTLLAAQGFVQLADLADRGRVFLRGRDAGLLVAAAVVAAPVVWWKTTSRWPYAAGSLTLLCSLLVVGTVCVAGLLWKRRPVAAGTALLLFFLAGHGVVYGDLLARLDHRYSAAVFGRRLRAEVLGRSEVLAYRMDRAHSGLDPVVYYLGEPVRRVESAEQLQRLVRRRGQVLVVAYETRLDELAELGRTTVVRRMEPAVGHPPPKHPLFVLVRLDGRSALAPTDPPAAARRPNTDRPRAAAAERKRSASL